MGEDQERWKGQQGQAGSREGGYFHISGERQVVVPAGSVSDSLSNRISERKP